MTSSRNRWGMYPKSWNHSLKQHTRVIQSLIAINFDKDIVVSLSNKFQFDWLRVDTAKTPSSLNIIHLQYTARKTITQPQRHFIFQTFTTHGIKVMLLSSVSVTLLICGVVFLVVDVVILLIGCLWWRKKKKQRDKERRVMDQEGATYVPLIKPNPGPFTTPIKAQSDVREFEIPKLSTNVRRDRSKWYDFGADEKPVSKILDSGLDPVQYCTPQQRILKNKPKVGFEFFYDFRTTQLKVTLHALKNIQRYIDEKISVTVLMSHSTILYHSAKVNAPNPVVNEEYPFPMDSMEISSDPPITCKFNVWHIDSSSLKRPYGFVEVNIEDVLTKMTNIGSSDKSKAGYYWILRVVFW